MKAILDENLTVDVLLMEIGILKVSKGVQKNFLMPVPNRNAQMIAKIIHENDFPGTKIITYQWRSYSAALRMDPEYEHGYVNHSCNFVDPENPTVHTKLLMDYGDI
ncbi:hypothetical protein NGRA_1021 [Nosema granulosis]|uniref:Transposase n=1 Tax=Nosema granulosis TaxID=83296 RepID=A0A9P6GZ82_9MICR|nr:hypothetical protein NGRA_1021 [Nosema granulosis]